MDKLPASTVILPALPDPRSGNIVCARIPNGPPMTASPVTVTETFPQSPEPKVEAEISPPLAIESEPALTLTSPAFPVPNPDSDVMPVERVLEVPSIDKAPATLTVTLLASPNANVPL